MNFQQTPFLLPIDQLLSGVGHGRIIYENDEPKDFICLEVNKAFEQQAGVSGISGQKASELLPQLIESDKDLIQFFARVANTGIPERKEYFVNALQTWFLFEVFSPDKGHFVVVIENIAERKKTEAALKARESQLQRVIEGSDQGFWDWNLKTNEFTVSARFETMLGYQAGEMSLQTENWGAYVNPDDLIAAQASIMEHLAKRIPKHEVELRIRSKCGEWVWVLTCGRVVEWDLDGNPVMMSGTHTNITDRKKSEQTLRQTAIAFGNTQEGIVVFDKEMRVLSSNAAFTQITGYEFSEIEGKTTDFLCSGRHDEAFFNGVLSELQDQGVWQGEIWNRRKNGEIYPQLTSINSVHDDHGVVTNYVTVFNDISAIKASEEQLVFLAYHDPLTLLPNRILLLSRLEHARNVVRRDGGHMALLLIDLDRFKDVNDSYGHLMGDYLLQRVSERLQSRLRSIDTLSRLGGDEFAILLEALTKSDVAAVVATDVLTALAEPWFLPNGTEVSVGASIGISMFPGPATNGEELLQQADAAMYRAKTEGRGRYRYFSDDLTKSARERLEMETRLRHAIDNDELKVYFQPQVDIGTGLIVGAEALVRWIPTGSTVITPDKFIPLAEETGLIVPLGRWVLQETCRIGQNWLQQGKPPLTLSVNVSAAQLRGGDFAHDVLKTLERTGFPSTSLEIELTESALMSGDENAIHQLRTLRDNDIRIALDDFGTGYSSLAYLKRFALDVIKIDRSFMEHLAMRRDDREIVTAIIQMGHTLGYQVVAEGVETPEQLAYLKDHGCDVYQGFLCSRPLPADQFANFRKKAVAALR